jgi:hypothetical protein
MGRITTTGLGSCVAIALYDAVARVGALAHILLPDRGLARDTGNPARFAETAVPALVLLGHVAFKVVQAYLFGPLLPSEYFVNALALGLVVSAAGAILGSVTLAGATAAVRRAGREHFEKGLDQLAHDALEQVGAPLERARDAAAKLAEIELP